jgi:uncharacterized membrane protein
MMAWSREWIEFAAQGVETLAVALIVSFIIVGTIRWLYNSARGTEGAYERYRIFLGKTVLIGLELLVAADIINTVAFALTLTNLARLGALVLVRTALGWTLTVEVEGHWPWQQTKESRIAQGENRRRPLPLNREKASERDSDAI